MSEIIKKKGIFRYTKLRLSEIRDLLDDLSFFYDSDLSFLKKYHFFKNSSEKVYIFNGEYEFIDQSRINSIGIYFGTFHNGNKFRLSIEGSKFVKPKQNYVKLNQKAFNSYITAENLFIDEVEEISKTGSSPFLIVVFEDENLGSVSIKENIILNYMPKSRKINYNKVF